ncbi:MAG TPA: hypothetical protein EYP80_00185 [Candidatus Aenigmarchaeota archaeon]|nr:hypothetical protein [Candidatus Aenigmarchaeota archaeon]
MGYVPAGSKLTIWNELYKRGAKPGLKDLTYVYEGKNVRKLIDFVPKLIQTIFSPTTWQQKVISVKENEYSAEWFMFKDLDYYSYLRIDVELKIRYKGDIGVAKIKLGEPVIVTEYPQETYWQKTFIYEILRVLWHNLFYNRKLQEYLEFGRMKVSCFEEKLLKYFEKLKNE